MVCQVIQLPGGGRAFVCGGRRARRKCKCGEIAGLQCDFPTRPGKTCDAYLCTTCAIEVGPDKHHCPSHNEADAAPAQKQLAFL